MKQQSRAVSPLAYSIDDAAHALGIGRSTMCALIASGRIHSVKLARKRIIPAYAIQHFLEGRADEAAA